jgi:predicted nuclease of predicted toxin-antitoxin system
MRILFDHGTPVPLRRSLPGHEVSTAYEMGWAELQNGDLLAAAEQDFQALITTDKNLRYQQNLAGRRLAILVLPTTSWPRIQLHIPEVLKAVNALNPGDFVELNFESP